MLKKTFVALSVVTLATGAAVLPMASAKAAADTSVQIAACAPKNPCNPCAATNPCAAANPCNPCAAKVVNPCNPCAAANPCAAKNPCNPCAAKTN
jgi:hypothetical protein